MFLQKFRAKRGIQWRRIGPSKHLLLSARIIQTFEKLAESVDKVAFGQQNENRKAYIQFALDGFELTRDFSGFPLHFFRRVFDQALDRDSQQEAIDRTVKTMLFQKPEELSPFARRSRFHFFKYQPAGGIQDHRIIREPPVHVDGSTDSLKLILQTRREAGLRMTDCLSLS